MPWNVRVIDRVCTLSSTTPSRPRFHGSWKSVDTRAVMQKKARHRVVDTTMDTVTMLRDLWRHRTAVVAVMALSVIAGVLVLYRFAGPLQLESRRYYVGVATAGVLIDTPTSQVATLSPEGAGDL